jgi:type IV pilus assembly protein PilE
MMMRNRNRGFTLVELLIVIAVLSIAIAIGYPSYRDQVRKARRAEGMGQLLELADRMERHYADLGTYDQADGSDMTAADIYTDTTDDGYYTLSVDAGTDNVQFTVRATPTTKGGQNKDKCGTFMLDSLGVRSLTGNSLSVDECWK